MPSTPLLSGPLTPEMQENMAKIRYCTIGIFAAAVGRLCTGDVPFNDLICGIFGIFLLKDDENVFTCYSCLASSPLGQCAQPGGGGIACLMPFLLVASFNCIFLLLRFFIGGPFLLLSFCFQFSGSVFAWRLNTMISAAALTELGTGGQGQPLNQPLTQMRMFPGAEGVGNTVGGGGRGGGGAGGGRAPGAGPMGPGGGRFVAFQGDGHRLGG